MYTLQFIPYSVSQNLIISYLISNYPILYIFPYFLTYWRNKIECYLVSFGGVGKVFFFNLWTASPAFLSATLHKDVRGINLLI